MNTYEHLRPLIIRKELNDNHYYVKKPDYVEKIDLEEVVIKKPEKRIRTAVEIFEEVLGKL
ncbi:hypothetical protein ACFL1H_04130 [Nanoarchaeota archaeon]